MSDTSTEGERNVSEAMEYDGWASPPEEDGAKWAEVGVVSAPPLPPRRLRRGRRRGPMGCRPRMTIRTARRRRGSGRPIRARRRRPSCGEGRSWRSAPPAPATPGSRAHSSGAGCTRCTWRSAPGCDRSWRSGSARWWGPARRSTARWGCRIGARCLRGGAGGRRTRCSGSSSRTFRSRTSTATADLGASRRWWRCKRRSCCSLAAATPARAPSSSARTTRRSTRHATPGAPPFFCRLPPAC